MALALNLIGKRIGQLVVLEIESRRNILSGKSFRWLKCRCDCGNEKWIIQPAVVHKHTISCGCRHLKHGDATGQKFAPEYNIWHGMKTRCADLKDHNYGGRGIKLSPEWNIYKNFLRDMGRRPGPQYSIDRIDVDGNYEPGNCRWATKSEQRKNTRPRTHCINGHEYTEANIYYDPRDHRQCRICRRKASRNRVKK